MANYNIDYEILNYEKFYRRLNEICLNEANKFPVEKLESLGKSKCGFNIEHFKIGNGPTHIVYMGGCHGNEIISVDYVTQLMKNIALGLGEYQSFDHNEFTIDFIPCQNPEGFFTTTYALNSYMKNMTDEEVESFSKNYYNAYKKDDINAITVNKIINTFCTNINLSLNKVELQKAFWDLYRNQEIDITKIINFLMQYSKTTELQAVTELVKSIWQEKLQPNYIIPKDKYHNAIFADLTIDCIPEIDEAHIKLKEQLKKLYKDNKFPIGTLANFFSNASGVNLNDNNEFFYNDLKERIAKDGNVYGNLRDNNLLKNIPGPIGTPCENIDEPFKYSEENIALLDFLASQEDHNYAFINCHGTGGLFYLYPVTENDMIQAHEDGVERKFQFYINNRLATEYTKETGKVYEEFTGTNAPYKTQGYPEKITGVGDVLRKKYLASFLLELSKAGGNPIAPYCDREGNYKLTMLANFRANAKMMQTILELKHLYNSSYTMTYQGKTVKYKVK